MLDFVVGVGAILFALVMLIVGTKLFWLARANNAALELGNDYSGINIVHGISGDQSGHLTEEQRISTESIRNI